MWISLGVRAPHATRYVPGMMPNRSGHATGVEQQSELGLYLSPSLGSLPDDTFDAL